MASKKRKNKIAKAGCGYNFENDNVHLKRKKSKVDLGNKLKSERRPQKKG